MFTLYNLLLMAPPEGQSSGGFFQAIFPLLVIVVIFYFLLIRPARKKQKDHEEMIRSLKNGDKVLTNGGIYGTVAGIGDNRIQLKIAEGVKIDIALSAVASKLSDNKDRGGL